MEIKTSELAGPYKSEVFLPGTYPVVLLPANCVINNLVKLLTLWGIKSVETLADAVVSAPVVKVAPPKKPNGTTQSVDLSEFI